VLSSSSFIDGLCMVYLKRWNICITIMIQIIG